MNNVEFPKRNLLYLLLEKGYEIKVEKDSTGGYSAYFDYKLAVNPSCKYSYSAEWTEQEIRQDIVYDLLKWSGLKITLTLDY